jgi:hypothetical protein
MSNIDDDLCRISKNQTDYLINIVDNVNTDNQTKNRLKNMINFVHNVKKIGAKTEQDNRLGIISDYTVNLQNDNEIILK